MDLNQMMLESRRCYEGGDDYVTNYLTRIESRESIEAYSDRRRRAYDPGCARASLLRIKDILSQGLDSVRREAPPEFYAFVNNANGFGASLNAVIQDEALDELLAVGGIYALLDRVGNTNRFVLSLIRREDIIGMAVDPETGELIGVKFNCERAVIDKEGFKTSTKTVTCKLLKSGSGYTLTMDKEVRQWQLPIIPFAYIELNHLLLEGVLRHERALMNLASSDLEYALSSNIPLLTQQVTNSEISQSLIAKSFEEDELVPKKEVNLRADGLKYPTQTERPGYIAPPIDPLRASMEKQAKLETQIREAILRNLSDNSDSRDADGGLCTLASKLQSFEQQLADIWKAFMRSSDDIVISYPTELTLLDSDEIKKRIDYNTEQVDKTTSLTMKKALLKENASLLLRGNVSDEVIATVYSEIDAANIVALDPELVLKQHSQGIIGTVCATTVSGYPAEEAALAEIDHAKRIARIALAQTEGAAAELQARGVDDMEVEPGVAALAEKAISQTSTLQESGAKAVRGEGQ